MEFNLGNLFEKAREMQSQMQEIKLKVENLKVTGESGGGMVKVAMNGDYYVTSIEIDPIILDSKDPKMLSDLLVGAINNAVENARNASANELQSIKANLPNIPGLNLDI